MAKLENYNNCFYDYNNLQQYCDKLGLCYDGEYLRWLKDIVNTKVQLFSYKGLPKGLTPKIVEMALLFRNFLCWYKSDMYGEEPILCIYRCGSDYDLYWQPRYVELLALNGKSIATRVPFEDIVLCRDNEMDIIPFLTLNSWIEKIIEMERTLSINVQLLRLPTIFTGDKSQVATFQAMFKSIMNFKPFAVASKQVVDSLQAIKIDLPCQPSEMYDLIEKYRNLALASVGIYSSDTKRERLITAEIQASNDFADIIYQGMVKERKEWVKNVNEKYGLHIELIETYNLLHEDNVKDKAQETKAVEEEKAKAQNLIKDNKEVGDTNE